MESHGMDREGGVPTADDETPILQVIEEWTSAQCAKDIDRLMSHYATDVAVFGIHPSCNITGADAWRREWEKYLSH